MGRRDEALADFTRAIDLDASFQPELAPYLEPDGPGYPSTPDLSEP